MDDTNHHIHIQQSQDNLRKPIEHKDVKTACRTLGLFDSPMSDPKAQMHILKQRSDEAAAALTLSKLTSFEVITLYRTIYRPQMIYPMPFTAFTKTQCTKIQCQMKRTLLHSLGLPQSLPNALVFAPQQLGGIGFSHLYTEQGIAASTMLLRTLRHHNDIDKTVRIYLRWYQHVTGVGFLVLEQPGDRITHVKETWLDELRYFLHSSAGSIILPNEPRPLLLREHDQYIMDVARQFLRGAQLKHVNAVRLYLQVERVSELATADGLRLPIALFRQGGPDRSNISSISTLLWPYATKPTGRILGTWRKLLRFLAPNKTSRLLSQPLGQWFSSSMDAELSRREWRNVYDSVSARVFRCEMPEKGAHIAQWNKYPIQSQLAHLWCLHGAPDGWVSSYPATSVPIDAITGLLIARPKYTSPQPAPAQPNPVNPTSTFTHQHLEAEASRNGIGKLYHFDVPGPAWMTDLLRFSFTDSFLTRVSEATLELYRALVSGNRTIIIATDGSYVKPHGGFGWCIATTKGKILWHGYGVTRGRPMSSFRSELYGRLAAFSFLKKFILYSRPLAQGFQVDSYCDNKAVLQREAQWRDRDTANSYLTMAPDYDAVQTLMQVQSDIPGMQLHNAHVKAHQDRNNKTNRRPLPTPAILNIAADKLATLGLAAAQRDQQSFIPLACSAYLSFQQHTLTSRYTNTMRFQTAEHGLIKYVAQKYSLDTIDTATAIAWQSISTARKQRDLQTTFPTKLLCNWLATAKRLHQESRSNYSYCVRCKNDNDDGALEDFAHFLRCPHIEAAKWRTDFCHQLQDHLQAEATPPSLTMLICRNAKSFLGNQPHLSDAQTHIGWENFFRGLITTSWLRQVDEHYGTLSTLNANHNGTTWGGTLIAFIWRQVRQGWVTRCQTADQHHQTAADRIRIDGLRHAIRELYDYSEATTYTRAFTQPLDTLLSTHEGNLQAWLTNHKENILRGHESFNSLPPPTIRQRSIRHYFHP